MLIIRCRNLNYRASVRFSCLSTRVRKSKPHVRMGTKVAWKMRSFVLRDSELFHTNLNL